MGTRANIAAIRTLVVLPTYNERDCIERALSAARKAVPEAEMLVVDDSSPDGTAALVEKAAPALGGVHLLVRPVKQGLGPAYRAGFAWGMERGFEALVEMDSDLSHDPAALPELLAPLGRGVDLCIGSRYVGGGRVVNWTPQRRLLSRGGNIYADICLGLGVRDSTSGFRAYTSALLQKIDLSTVRADGYGFQIEMTMRARASGACIREIPIVFSDRAGGRSKMSRAVVAEAVWLVTKWGASRLLGQPREASPASGDRPLGGRAGDARSRPPAAQVEAPARSCPSEELPL